jgi:hypothetical protein
VASVVNRSGGLVQILVGQELEKAGEREQRRAKLVGGVGDELLAGAVELRQLNAHPVERRRQLADLVVAVVHDRFVERPLGDAVGSSLKPSEPARVHRGNGEAEHDRDQERRDRRKQQAPLDEGDGRELVRERARQHQDVALGEQRHGDLRVLAAVVAHPGAHRADRPRGLERNRISLDLRAPGGRGVGQLDDLAGAGRDPEENHARIRDEAPLVDEVAELRVVLRLQRGVVDCECRRVPLQLVELRRNKAPLQRRHHDRVRDEQRATDDSEQRQRQLDADAAGDRHPSRKR